MKHKMKLILQFIYITKLQTLFLYLQEALVGWFIQLKYKDSHKIVIVGLDIIMILLIAKVKNKN